MPHDAEFEVEILQPPFFTKTGKTIDRREAWKLGLWYGGINLWVISTEGVPSIIYQKRSPNIGWAPGKLDVSAAEHYEDLDTVEDGLKRIAEEIGKTYKLEELTYLGKKVNVGIGTNGTIRNTVSDVFLVKDSSPLTDFVLDGNEVYAICKCPIDEMYKVQTVEGYTYTTTGLRPNGDEIRIEVSKESFPDNYDNYPFKIVQLAKRFVNGETELLY